MEIEATTLLSMLRTEVLPAAIRYQTELARAVTAMREAGDWIGVEGERYAGLVRDVCEFLDEVGLG